MRGARRAIGPSRSARTAGSSALVMSSVCVDCWLASCVESVFEYDAYP